MTTTGRAQRLATLVVCFSLLLQPAGTHMVAAAAEQQTAKPAPPAQPAGTPRPATPAASTQAQPVLDGGWPRVYGLEDGGSILVYQPQIASWANQRDMLAFSAVSYRDKAGSKPVLGTIRLETRTRVALEDRLVNFDPLKIVEANFQTLPKEQVRGVVAAIEKAIPDDERVIALDRVLANLDKSQIVPKNVEGIKADPPAILFSKTPAIIVNLDGEPIWSPIKENDLKYAVNTNWELFQHAPTATLYLRHHDTWLKASDV